MPSHDRALPPQYPLGEFARRFPDEEACLRWLWRTTLSPDGRHAHCEGCGTTRLFRRYSTAQRRRSWTCTACGRHVQPTAGPIFAGSATSLELWFYATYLMVGTRGAISARQLERELGVTYKTAWRMRRKIAAALAAPEERARAGLLASA